jgi:hypothetical protein
MAPLVSNLTRSFESHSNISISGNITPPSTESSGPVSDALGTLIFGIIASVLATIAIILGYLQLRKTSSYYHPPQTSLCVHVGFGARNLQLKMSRLTEGFPVHDHHGHDLKDRRLEAVARVERI